ncbi:DapH/DapD/GlmU-related protein [Bacteroides helcogenes]|uniref:DapH/DapD/GlmU-related protein n=1 Tax=Bacteroides helcogenes TaxID=290053 RepID=UPI0002F4EB83|nr:DapH/DapD/GlmU-related protein [Bacteroides helcogenes]MDY5236946.1 DapH/DapD/GlmU-related protein [Bacteroides helcogenes]
MGKEYEINNGVAIHRTATLGHGVTIKAPAIIGPHCFVGTHSYLRGGVYMAEGAKVGISCEIKQSILMHNSAVAHFNFIGNSIIGHDANFEAGSITANHYNERTDKSIFVTHHARRIHTGVQKFGALVGDGCRIGANAVLSPGTLLPPGTVVARLQLVEQNPV